MHWYLHQDADAPDGRKKMQHLHQFPSDGEAFLKPPHAVFREYDGYAVGAHRIHA